MDVSPGDGGIVTMDQVALSYYPSNFAFNEGEYVSLEAVPASRYRFDNWSGAGQGTTNPTTIVMDCDKSITANFSPVTHTLTIQLSGNGSITPTVGTHVYGEGTVVSLTTAPDGGWQFDSWTGDVADSSSATTAVTMDSDKIITANFSKTMTAQLNWPLVSGIIGGLAVVAVLFVVVRKRGY